MSRPILPQVPPYTQQAPNPANVTVATTAPSSIANSSTPVGSLAVNTATGTFYGLVSNASGTATWAVLGGGSSDVNTLTGDSGGAITPTGGTITLAGGHNITTAGSGHTITFNVSGTTNHSVQVGKSDGSLTSLSVGTTGQVLIGATGADPAFGSLGVNSGLSGLIVGNNNSAFTTASFTSATSFTPAFSLATPGDATWTYSTQFGRYAQIGNLVFFAASVTWSNFANTTGSGTWRISLPAAAGAFTLPGQIFVNGSGIDASAETANLPANFYGKIATGANVCVLSVQEGGVGNAAAASFDLTVTQVKTAGTLTVSGWYFAS